MTNGTVTNKDLYEAIEKLESKIAHRLEKVEECVADNTAWRNQLTGKLAVMMGVVGLSINIVWDKLFNR